MAIDSLTAPMDGAEHREIGGVHLDVARAGDCRVKRVIYPPGFRWSRWSSQLHKRSRSNRATTAGWSGLNRS